ncbi:MAG: hypothetical protein NXY57DRAFT_907664 [Lentinula lateritia]|uniref:Uncharacterized protein n=1 Tax=Lentinula lateritia TaxID=40482 RepID=A0ABQ8V1H6_9AGAR|nr:MAG: hypothetical protein NXY57DRAFT_907664 [Lentinula lateritia]KAJ4464706.1 hypothetical protein C8R41DRAFT_782430 [Lentinula lateritia]
MLAKGYGPLAPCVTFLENLSDLPNLTSRHLLVNEATKHFLQKELPHLTEPSFQDIHPSLGNLDHLQVYIDRACDSVYPHGTGWSGSYISTVLLLY